MSAQELDTHNLLCHGFVELVRSIKPVDEDIKIFLHDAGKCIIMDIEGPGLPSTSHDDIVPFANDHIPLEDFITQCIVKKDLKSAFKRISKVALQQIMVIFQKLRLPVGQSLFATHVTLNKILPSPEPLDVELFDNHECRPREIHEGLKHGSFCLKLIEAHIGEIMHHQAFGLHPLIEKLERIFSPEEKEQFAEDGLRSEGIETFRRLMDTEDPLNCDRALIQQSLDKIIACHQVIFMARLFAMNQRLKNYHETVLQIQAEVGANFDGLVAGPSSHQQVALGTGIALASSQAESSPCNDIQSSITSTASDSESTEEAGDSKQQAFGVDATRFDGPRDGY